MSSQPLTYEAPNPILAMLEYTDADDVEMSTYGEQDRVLRVLHQDSGKLAIQRMESMISALVEENHVMWAKIGDNSNSSIIYNDYDISKTYTTSSTNTDDESIFTINDIYYCSDSTDCYSHSPDMSSNTSSTVTDPPLINSAENPPLINSAGNPPLNNITNTQSDIPIFTTPSDHRSLTISDIPHVVRCIACLIVAYILTVIQPGDEFYVGMTGQNPPSIRAGQSLIAKKCSAEASDVFIFGPFDFRVTIPLEVEVMESLIDEISIRMCLNLTQAGQGINKDTLEYILASGLPGYIYVLIKRKHTISGL